jgi:hypothetical protein
VFKEGDDLMSATRYAIMCLRSARTKADRVSFDRDISYPQMGFY